MSTNSINIFVKKHLRQYWLFWLLALVIFLLFVLLLKTGDTYNSEGWKWYSEVISASLGAAIVTTITYLLLKGQAKTESDVDQKKRVFENRLKAYEDFLTTLCDVVVRNVVTATDEKHLQFSIATIGMHANSRDMYLLAKNLKSIVLKIKTGNSPNNSIWNEILEIIKIFQMSLYDEYKLETGSELTKALCSFSGLCSEEHRIILEYLECMIVDFGFDTFIADRCLFISIPILPEMIKKLQKDFDFKEKMPDKIYITLKIENEENKTYDGFIAIYCGRNEKAQALIYNIYGNEKNEKYWINPKTEKRKKPNFQKYNYISEKENVEKTMPLSLSINTIYHAYLLKFKNKKDVELQTILVDIFSYIYKLWACKGKFVTVKLLEKNEDTKEYEIKKVKFDFSIPRNGI